jgi:hypothetical protein
VSSDPPRPQRRTLRPERLLPFACIVAAVALLASELMTTFELTRNDVAASSTPCTLDAASRHHFALGVLAVFAIVATVVAVLSGSKPAAIGVAIAGILALLLFLVIDLPDANSVGTLPDSCSTEPGSLLDGKALPRAGFWLELAGSVALAVSGVILATLTPTQLAALRPRALGGPRDPTARRRRSRPVD